MNGVSEMSGGVWAWQGGGAAVWCGSCGRVCVRGVCVHWLVVSVSGRELYLRRAATLAPNVWGDGSLSAEELR